MAVTENSYHASSKLLSEVETIILDEWFEHLITTECCAVDLFVYLRTNPAVAMERIRKRNRDGESTVSMDYLNSLHNLHEEWFAGGSAFPMPSNCVVSELDEANFFFAQRTAGVNPG